MNKTNLVVAFFVAAVLAGLFVNYGSALKIPMGASKENFMQKQVGMPLNGQGMGPYDEVSLTGASGWASSEPLPVTTSPANSHSDENKLMLLEGNKTSPDCCPGVFNTDTGCVCLSDTDRNLFASRGGNRA
jgi:hypothetical protein